MDRQEQTLIALMEEYKALKAEQGRRIGFRDNLLYVTLGLFGAIASIALGDPPNPMALLVIPLVCLALGWMYLVNDEKISAIGLYVRLDLDDRIRTLIGGSADSLPLFGWETAHRDDKRRKRRKLEQLFIDELTFVVAGLVAIGVCLATVDRISVGLGLLGAIEAVLLVALGVEIVIYADLGKGRKAPKNYDFKQKS
ncbi:MAG: hypothetical protein HC795_08195 [Coleofasciculaceae cyanobacterium RL_1_1]|nr:hypothetical protein [Coleofasciculaceae cyanobacterium RL_1_1]